MNTKPHASGDDHYQVRATQVVMIFTEANNDHYRPRVYKQTDRQSDKLPLKRSNVGLAHAHPQLCSFAVTCASKCICTCTFVHVLLYREILSRVQIFVDLPPNPLEEIFNFRASSLV